MNRITGLIAAGMFVAATMTSAFAASPAPSSAPPSAAAATAPANASNQGTAVHKSNIRRASLPKKRVEAIQAALKNNGEQIAVDGVWGQKTRGALKDFQQKHGMKATGRADQATLGQLKVANM